MGSFIIARKIDLVDSIKDYINIIDKAMEQIYDTTYYENYIKALEIRNKYISDTIEAMKTNNPIFVIYTGQFDEIVSYVDLDLPEDKQRPLVTQATYDSNKYTRDYHIIFGTSKCLNPKLKVINSKYEFSQYVIQQFIAINKFIRHPGKDMTLGERYVDVLNAIINAYYIFRKDVDNTFDRFPGCYFVIKDWEIHELIEQTANLNAKEDNEKITFAIYNLLSISISMECEKLTEDLIKQIEKRFSKLKLI